MPTAYSYIRFSSKKQEKGDSIRRQTRLRDGWLERHPEYTLDETLELEDLGKSAFRRKNMDSGYLGEFLQLVREGKIHEGSILLMENMDRFSRADPWDVTEVFRDLVRAGVDVVLLGNGEQIITRSNMKNMAVFLPTVISMQLAHEESAKKSERSKAAWEEKRRKAIAGGSRMSRRCPAWLKWNKKAEHFEVKPEAVEAIEHIYRRALEGTGQRLLTKEMNEKFPGIGPSKQWNQTNIHNILTSRTVLGEGQCYRMTEDGKRVKDGPAIPNYYPRIIPDSLFRRVQACIKSRDGHRIRYEGRVGKEGRDAKFVNLFRGVMVSSDGHPIRLEYSLPKNGQARRRLTSAGHLRGLPPVEKGKRRKHTCHLSISYAPVERMVMLALVEIKAADLEAPMVRSEESIQFHRDELAAITQRLAELEKALIDDSTSAVSELQRAIEEQRRRRDAKQQEIDGMEMDNATAAASPLKEIRSIVKHVESKPAGEQYNLRLKLRNLIASVVERIELLPRKTGSQKRNDRVTAEIIIRPKAGGPRLIADVLGVDPPKLDTPADVVKAFGGRVTEEEATSTVIIQGGAKPKHVAPSPPSSGKKGKGTPRKPR